MGQQRVEGEKQNGNRSDLVLCEFRVKADHLNFLLFDIFNQLFSHFEFHQNHLSPVYTHNVLSDC